MNKQLSIVTTTLNSIQNIDKYLSLFAALDRSKFDWIVVDAGSDDGTFEYLAARSSWFSHFESGKDAGYYFGLNKAVAHVKTPYYMVFGTDDRPSPTLLSDVLPLLDQGYALVLGGVRLLPKGTLKLPRPRFLHPIGWSQVISHHSVGTVIRTDVHERHGMYDVKYPLLADGLLMKRILKADYERILVVSSVFGDFMLGGMSSTNKLRSAVETFLVQVAEGSNLLFQLVMLNFRILRHYLLRLVKR